MKHPDCVYCQTGALDCEHQEEWQEILHKESNGVKLWERGVGVYTVEYLEAGKRHEPVFFDWSQAQASFENHATSRV